MRAPCADADGALVNRISSVCYLPVFDPSDASNPGVIAVLELFTFEDGPCAMVDADVISYASDVLQMLGLSVSDPCPAPMLRSKLNGRRPRQPPSEVSLPAEHRGSTGLLTPASASAVPAVEAKCVLKQDTTAAAGVAHDLAPSVPELSGSQCSSSSNTAARIPRSPSTGRSDRRNSQSDDDGPPLKRQALSRLRSVRSIRCMSALCQSDPQDSNDSCQ